MGCIEPIMDEAGLGIGHEHNHHGQCWWEIRSKENVAARISSERMPSAVGEIAGDKDVRLHPNWQSDSHHLYLPRRMSDEETGQRCTPCGLKHLISVK